MPRTTVFGVYERWHVWRASSAFADHLPIPPPHVAAAAACGAIIAKHAVLAAGATERSIVFGGE